MNIDQMMMLSVLIAGAGFLVLSMLLGTGNKKAAAVWFATFIAIIGMSVYFGINGATLLLDVVILIVAFWLTGRILGKSPKK